MDTEDTIFIKQTLNLAKKGMGWTNPNPMVGAVLVKNGQVIGKGYHKKMGLSHGEIEALKSSKVNPQGATLYVNLEPCSHWGKTPPCTDAIIKAKIARVVCSSLDPNSKVSGKGIDKLRKVGINVATGMLEDEARALNEVFFTFHQKKRPFIALKFASSLDGKIATKTGDSKWITNEKARNHARKLRSQYQAVLVGINTVLKDDPHLGNSHRIILDSTLKISMKAQVLRDKNAIIATTVNADKEKLKKLKSMGITVIKFGGKQVPLKGLLRKLYEKEIISIFVEGGATVLKSFIEEKLFDKVYAFYAPIIIGGEKAKTITSGKGVSSIKDAINLNNISFKRFGDNSLMIGYQNYG